jgi:hypothetical protein
MRKTLARFGPWEVAGLVLVVYGLWLAVVFGAGRDPRDFIIINRAMVESCHASSVIHVDPRYHYQPNNLAYDGAQYYLIALDPLHAACYLDNPGYRYTRILYPIAARLLALNQLNWIPATMILINLLAIAGGALTIALWLRRKGVSPWFALVYGFYPGLFVSLWRDLTEPLSYGLAALAVYLFDFGGKWRVRWAGLAFALSILARETALVFAVVYGLALLRGRRWRDGAELLGLALLPFVVYKLFIFTHLRTGSIAQLTDYPFGGLFQYWPWPQEQIDLALVVALPGIVCAAVVLWALARRLWTVEVMSFALNVLGFVILLPGGAYIEYYATGRASAGVILAALLALPALDKLTARNRTWLWTSNILWFMPWHSLVPLAVLWADPKV